MTASRADAPAIRLAAPPESAACRDDNDDDRPAQRLGRACRVLASRDSAHVLAVAVGAALLFGWQAGRQGWGNAYYAAAAQAGAHSWTAFFFGSLEVGNAVATDKPPAALWLMSLSVRAFGMSGWALLLPQLVESVAAVVVLHRAVHLVAGPRAALLAAGILTTTPVLVVLARFDDPDTLLTLLVTCAAYCTVRATRSEHRGWLVALGASLGLAFLTKWMVAFLPAPAMALTLARDHRRRWQDHLRRWGIVATSAVVTGMWWVVADLAVPASSRPYADASQGSVLDLIIGRNGFSRLGPAASGSASGVSGAPGPLRLLLPPFSGQIGWLLPLAVGALVVPSLVARRWTLPPAYLLFGGWLAAGVAVFSVMGGPMHPYYAGLVAPAMAALVGMGAADLWRARRRGLLLAACVADAAYAVVVASDYTGLPRWAGWLVAGSAGTALVLATLHRLSGRRHRPLRIAAAAAAAGCVLAGPAVFGAMTSQHTVTGADPLAGPGKDGDAHPYPGALVAYLRARMAGQTWLAAVPTATPAGRLQLQSGDPVLPIGGFVGTARGPTLSTVQHWVGADRLRYLVLAGPYAPDPAASPAALRGSQLADIVSWARGTGCPHQVPGTTFTVIDLDGGACH